MSAVFDVVITGIDELKKATRAIEQSSYAQEELQRQSVSTTRALGALIQDGFTQLTKAIAANSKATTENQAARVASISSVKQLSAALATTNFDLQKTAAALQAGSAAATQNATAVRALISAKQGELAVQREVAMATEASVAATNQLSASYSRIASVTAERMNLENGSAAAIGKRLAVEEASLAVTRQQTMAQQIAINEIKARTVAESGLSRAESDRALVELGLIRADQALDLAQKKATASTRSLMLAQVDMHAVMRGASAAANSLFLTYGNMIPMIMSFVGALTAIKGIKIGAEFDQTAKYIEAIQDESHGAALGLDEIKKGLLDIKGVGRTPQELADGVKELVKAGIPAAQAISEIANVAKFATVVETDLAKASELITGQWLAWGEATVGAKRGMTSMAEGMDLIAFTVDKTKAGIEDLRVALNYLTPLSKLSQSTYTDMLAIAGAMANVGIAGSMMGTSVRTGLIRTQAGAGKLIEKFGELGAAFKPYADEQKKTLKEGIEMFDALFKAANQLNPADRTRMVAMALGLRATSLAALDLGDSFEKTGATAGSALDEMQRKSGQVAKSAEVDVMRLKALIETQQQMSRAKQGFVGTVFEKMSDNAIFKIEEMKGAIQRAMAGAFDDKEVGSAFDKLIKTLNSSGFKEMIADLMKGTTGLIQGFATLTSGPMVHMVTALGKALVLMTGAVALSKLWGMYTAVVAVNQARATAAQVASVATLTSGLVILAGAGGVMFGTWLNKFEPIRQYGAAYIDMMLMGAEVISTAFSLGWEVMSTGFKAVVMDMGNFLASFLDQAAADFSGLANALPSWLGGGGSANRAETLTGWASSLRGMLPKNDDRGDLGSRLTGILKDSKRDWLIDRDAMASVREGNKEENYDKSKNGLAELANQAGITYSEMKKFTGGTYDMNNALGETGNTAEEVKQAVGGINLDGITGDIQRFIGVAEGSMGKFDARTHNEVDGLVEKVKKFALANKTSEAEVWKSVGTTEAALKAAGEAKIKAFNTESTEKFKASIRDIKVDLDALSGKTESTDKFAIGMARTTKQAEELKNKFKDLATQRFNEGNAASYAEAMAQIAKEAGFAGGAIEEVDRVAANAAETLKATIIDDYAKSYEDLKDSIIELTPHQKILNEITKKFVDQRKELEESKGARTQADYNSELAKLIWLEEEAKRTSVELGKTSNNLWAGFNAGVMEAQKNVKTLGTLGYEVFGHLRDGIKETFVDALKGDFDQIPELWKGVLDKMKDSAVDFMAEKLTSMTTGLLFEGKNSLFGGLLDSLGMGGFGTERGSSAANPVHVVGPGMGGLGGEAGGAVGMLEGAKGWLGEVFGDGVASALGTALSAVGVGAGAFGLFSGAKAMKEGNYGSGAMQLAAGGASMYKGLVGLEILESGAFTGAVKSAAASMGLLSSSTGSAVAGISSLSQGAGTAYGTFQAAASGGGAAAAGGGSSAAAGAGMGIGAMAAVFAPLAIGLMKRFTRVRYDQGEELTKARVTPGQLDASGLTNAFKKIEGTLLESIPGFSKYGQAAYDAKEAMLLLSSGTQMSAVQFNAATGAWSKASITATGSYEQVTNMHTQVTSQMVVNMQRRMEAERGAAVSLTEAARATNALAMAASSAANSENGAASYAVHLAAELDSLSGNASAAAGATSNLAGDIAAVASRANGAKGGLDVLASGMTGTAVVARNSASAFGGLMSGMQSLGSVASNTAGNISSAASRIMQVWNNAQSTSNKRFGGMIGYANGGVLQGGSGYKDDLYLGSVNGVAQMAMGGEYIMPKSQTKKYKPILESMRRQEYASGGTVAEFMQDIRDELAELDMSDFQKSLAGINKEYTENMKSGGELGISAADKLVLAQLRDKKTSMETADRASELSDFNKDINYEILKFTLTDSQKNIEEAKRSMEDSLKQAAELGATELDLANIRKLAGLEIEKITNEPLTDAVSTLKSFRDSLEGTTEKAKSSAAAQSKLFEVLTQAQAGDFSGVATLADIIKDISINKSDYATAADYARDYWRTMTATTELEKLTGVKAKVPGYASGGVHMGGLRVVGENGPEVEYTGPARIYNQDQLIDLSEVVRELRALRRETTSGNYAIAKFTMKSAKVLETMQADGLYLDAGEM